VKTKMMNLRKIAVLALTALLVMGVSGLSMVKGMPTGETTSAPALNPLTSLINTLGDDLFSTVDLATLVDPASPATPTTHYGPYASSSPDSGTCGNFWADDTFDRHFTVFTRATGITIVEQFKDGSFITPSTGSVLFSTPPSPSPNPSPGACETSLVPQGTVDNGVTGSLHGYFVIPLQAGSTQDSNSPYCNALTSSNTDCTGTTFIETHFTSCYPAHCPVDFSVTTFFDHYAAGGQGLIITEWKNASADRGGNHGDIRSSNTV